MMGTYAAGVPGVCVHAMARILEPALYIRVHTDMVGTICFAGVALLTLVAPFELTAPVLRLPSQSVSR